MKDYGSVAIRLFLLILQGLFLLTAITGIYWTFKNKNAVWLPVLILVYFTVHIAFAMVPRYAVPAMPYLFIFSAAGLLKIIETVKGCKG